jgi:hypothetical protein
MHLTSRKDMIVGLSLAGALLCFKLGEVFGPDPPSWFYRDLATASAAPSPASAQPAPTARARPAPDGAPLVATFIDSPAQIGDVRVSGSKASTRVAVQLGPGQTDPRLRIAARDGQPMLTVSGLASPTSRQGEGSGLVERWELGDAGLGGRLDLPLTAPARVSRAFLVNLNNGDRRLILDLAPACPVGAGRRLRIVVAPPRAVDARQVAALD